MSTTTIIVIDIAVILVLALIGYVVYYQFFKRKEIPLVIEKPKEEKEKYSISDFENIVSTLKPKQKDTPIIIINKEAEKDSQEHHHTHNEKHEHEEQPKQIKLDDAIIGGIIIEKKH